jgi:hypothetical protein
MNLKFADEFSKLTLPKTFLRSIMRFSMFLCCILCLYLLAPTIWNEWLVGLILGLVGGFIWVISWRWKGLENRLIVWLIGYLGTMAYICSDYRASSFIGALVCMHLGGEFMMLVFYHRLRAWTANEKD